MTRRPDQFTAEQFSIDFEHPSITATTAFRLPWKARAPYRIERVYYVNQTGLAEDAANAFAGTLKDNAGNVVATIFDTDADEAGTNTLAAATVVTGVLVEAQATGAADDMLNLAFVEDGAATLPAGNVRVEGYYL